MASGDDSPSPDTSGDQFQQTNHVILCPNHTAPISQHPLFHMPNASLVQTNEITALKISRESQYIRYRTDAPSDGILHHAIAFHNKKVYLMAISWGFHGLWLISADKQVLDSSTPAQKSFCIVPRLQQQYISTKSTRSLGIRIHRSNSSNLCFRPSARSVARYGVEPDDIQDMLA